MFRSRLPLVLAAFTCGPAAASCGSEGLATEPAPAAGIDVVDITAVSARNIRIRWTPKAGEVRIERAVENGDFAEVAVRPANRGRFLDLALEPVTAYRYRLSHCSASVCGPPQDLGWLSTPPTRLKPFKIEVPADGTQDDVALFGVATLDPDLLDSARMAAVDRQGKVVWEYGRDDPMIAPVTEVHLLEDGTLATGHNTSFIRMDLDGTELYRYEGNTAHHDIDPIAGGGFIFLTFDVFADHPGDPILGDGIEIVGAGNQFPSWSWRARDHIARTDRDPIDWDTVLFGIGRDWTHANALTFDEAAGKIYLNVRNLNRLYCIDYPSGDVRWVMGDGGDFGEGLWSHSHDPTFVADNRFLVFDNGAQRPGTELEYTRIIEVEFDAEAKRADIVWEYRESPDFYAFAQGALGVQPDGNIFVTDGVNARIFELTREKKLVWQLRMLGGAWSYKAITIPRSVFSNW